MVRPRDIIDEHVDLLREKIDDPNPSREQDQEEYIKAKPLSLGKARYPYIRIEKANNTMNGRGVGKDSRENQQRITVSIVAQIGDKLDVDDDNVVEDDAEDVLDWLANEIVKKTARNQSRFRNLGDVDKYKPVNDTSVATNKNSVVRHNVECIAQFER